MSTPAPTHPATSDARARLQDRYGRHQPRRGLRRVLIALGIMLSLGLLVMLGVQVTDRPVRSDVISYEHASAGAIDLTFRVTMRPGVSARCAVEALDASRGQVGFTELEIPAQERAESTHRVRIETQGDPVSAQVVSCERL